MDSSQTSIICTASVSWRPWAVALLILACGCLVVSVILVEHDQDLLVSLPGYAKYLCHGLHHLYEFLKVVM